MTQFKRAKPQRAKKVKEIIQVDEPPEIKQPYKPTPSPATLRPSPSPPTNIRSMPQPAPAATRATSNPPTNTMRTISKPAIPAASAPPAT